MNSLTSRGMAREHTIPESGAVERNRAAGQVSVKGGEPPRPEEERPLQPDRAEVSPMRIHNHSATTLGRAFLWGGIGLGAVLLAALLTDGFGLFAGRRITSEETPLVVREGDRIRVPVGSPLRDRLAVVPAPAEAVSSKLSLP